MGLGIVDLVGIFFIINSDSWMTPVIARDLIQGQLGRLYMDCFDTMELE